MPIPEFDGLDETLEGLDVRPVRRRQLLAVARLLKLILSRLDNRVDNHDSRLDGAEARLRSGDVRLTNVEGAGLTFADALTTLQSANVLLLNVVASPGQLPATAPVRQWYRVAGDDSVYVGNGANRPLTKLTPAPV